MNKLQNTGDYKKDIRLMKGKNTSLAPCVTENIQPLPLGDVAVVSEHREVYNGGRGYKDSFLSPCGTLAELKFLKILNQVQNDKNFERNCVQGVITSRIWLGRGCKKAAFTPHQSGYSADNFGKTPRLLRSAGFTLAEVLITIGVIGVVAAMTIPTIITNTKARQYKSTFKKTIATLSNAGRMAEAQYGFDYAGINKTCNANSGSDNPESVQSICALLNGTLKGATFYYGNSNLKVKNGGKYEPYSPYLDNTYSLKNFEKNPTFQFSDGTLLVLSSAIGEHPCTGNGLRAGITDDGFGTACYGIIDVNGTSLPNREIDCSEGTNKAGSRYYIDKTCKVKDKDITDIYPVLFHDGIVEPYSSAAKAVYDMAK
ncbi:type II secretion system protein [bacterium]|nr:type II secretion system protein [bacterium]